jgi:hypothetical protein
MLPEDQATLAKFLDHVAQQDIAHKA